MGNSHHPQISAQIMKTHLPWKPVWFITFLIRSDMKCHIKRWAMQVPSLLSQFWILFSLQSSPYSFGVHISLRCLPRWITFHDVHICVVLSVTNKRLQSIGCVQDESRDTGSDLLIFQDHARWKSESLHPLSNKSLNHHNNSKDV